MKTYELVIDRNQSIKKTIEKFVIDKGWDKAYISGGIGSAFDIELTNPISNELPPKLESTFITGPAEVLSFTGEVMKREMMDEVLKKLYKDDSPLFIHIHLSCSTKDSSVYGGGLREGYSFRSIKVYINEI